MDSGAFTSTYTSTSSTTSESKSAHSLSPLSVMDIFRIGIGPSSSHTVGPMRAGAAFAAELAYVAGNMTPARLSINLYGSLGATGRGHNTDRAVLLGLAGYAPETVSISQVEDLLPSIARTGQLVIHGGHAIAFDIAADVKFLPAVVLPYHVNALTITAHHANASTAPILQRTYYSVGGGFVMAQISTCPENAGDDQNPVVRPLDEVLTRLISSNCAHSDTADPLTFRHDNTDSYSPESSHSTSPYSFTTGAQLLAACEASSLSIAQLVRANEEAHHSAQELDAHLDLVANTMFDCVDAGMSAQGFLPGGLDVPRRAHALSEKLHARVVSHPSDSTGAVPWASTTDDPMRAMDWVNLYALAVNEENAAGHRVVTAPTNGAAGVIPAVLGYLVAYCPEAGIPFGAFAPTNSQRRTPFRLSPDNHDEACVRRRRAVHDFLLAATAIGVLIKTNASIAGAEVGCQGEVGSASAMAAAGLAQALGGTPHQVENAAEIAMEHSLGLTCDPVAGLVQIPCIERNAIAAVKAINAARMALWGDGRHTVSLDAVIETMRQTGVDMLSKYKETSAGGLAVNVVEC
ncbi:L-serine ammonia-lyase, iron-sulfur-dependent, subunit alpha [Schaalia sp. lx-260]|uniref:L-serine ammonia-lyase, iron-sulfur-dependent, subunit alpha n=1 Tax=Schaalia sp. lx-260 TaxID=2899082 RepID=UPI003FA750E9